MRLGLILFGAVLGVMGYIYLTETQQQQQQQKQAETTEDTQTPVQPHLNKHAIQDDESREAVGAMIDEVVHHDDIPDTPVKQAFAHAVES